MQRCRKDSADKKGTIGFAMVVHHNKSCCAKNSDFFFVSFTCGIKGEADTVHAIIPFLAHNAEQLRVADCGKMLALFWRHLI